MNSIIQLVASAIIAIIIVVIVMRQTKRAETKMSDSIGELKTSLKQVTSILHEYRKFRTAFDSSYDAMVIADINGTVLFINSSVTRITGFSRAEAIGTKAGKLWGGLMGTKYYERLWKQVKSDKQPLVTRIVNKRKNGERYLADVTITPILDDNGKKVEHFIAVERDLGMPPVGAIAALNAGGIVKALYLPEKSKRVARKV